MKKILAQTLIHRVASFLMLIGAVSLFSPTQTILANSDIWFGTLHRPELGSGTQEDPYLITNAEEMAFLIQNYDYNSGICNHKFYRLTTDLDMQWTKWRYGTADYDSRSFRGHFDGAGHKISHIMLCASHSPVERHYGLFAQLGGDDEFESVIENLEIDGISINYLNNPDVTVPAMRYVIGGLVGQMYRNSRIENCIVRGMFVNYECPATDVKKGQFYKIAPIVGDIQDHFGEDKDNAKVSSARIINTFGKLEVTPNVKLTGNVKVQNVQGEGHHGKYNDYTWHKLANGDYSFSACDVEISDAYPNEDRANTVFNVKVSADAEGKKLAYKWYEDEKPLKATTSQITIDPSARPRCISCEVYDAGSQQLLGADAIYVHPAYAEMIINPRQAGTGTYNLNAQFKSYRADFLERDLVYSWRDMTDGGKEVGTSKQLTGARLGHTYQLIANHRRWKFYTFSQWQSFTQPIFVSLHGISEAQKNEFTTDGQTYPEGDDRNNGSSPKEAVRTLKRAYELIQSRADGAVMGQNVIVIMGEYDQPVFNTHFDLDGNKPNPDYFVKNKPAVILGKYGNITGGRLLFNSERLSIDEETLFENIIMHGSDVDGRHDSDIAVVYANDHNLTFGYGIRFDNYRIIDTQRGLINGSHAPHFTVYGGFLNIDEPDYQYKEHTITIKSGYFGRVIAGNRFSKYLPRTGQIGGNPRYPVRTHLVIDVCNAISDCNKPFDVALVVGGQGDGSSYAVSTIDILGTSMVGRVIGGNIGFGRPGKVEGKKGISYRPADSFFGQTVINVRNGIVNEIYGGSLGRVVASTNPDMKDQLIDTCSTYFYGKSIINISGGMVRNTIYAAGAGSVSGVDGSDGAHTFDPLIPYMLSNGQIAYGDYKEAKGKMPRVYCSGDSVIDLNHTIVAINVSDNAFLRGTIYGGGHGFSNLLRTNHASSQAGCLFGDSYINISGGHIKGYIFGGGRGSLSYFDNHDNSDYPVVNGIKRDKTYFAHTAQVHGNTHVSVSGGDVDGLIFGAGEGTYYRPTSSTDATNLASQIAAVFGATYVDISDNAVCHDFIFGGGNYGDVRKSTKGKDKNPNAGSTFVTIRGGKIMNSIFGGGHGHYVADHPELCVMSDIEGDAHVNVTGGEFVWTETKTRYTDYGNRRFYGIYGSGRSASIIYGDTYVEAHRSLFSQEFLEKAGLSQWDRNSTWEGAYAICGGGFGWATDVMGDTHVLIDVDNAPKFDKSQFNKVKMNVNNSQTLPFLSFMEIFGGGLRGHVYGSTEVTVKGNGYIRSIYGGGMAGSCGLRDKALSGDLYSPDYSERNYTTRSTVNFLSGACYHVYGGSLMGNITGETTLNLGSPTDSIGNSQLIAYDVFGGNDVTGTIAGSNNPAYGAHINMYGGEVYGDMYGSGNGSYNYYYRPAPDGVDGTFRNLAVGRERPHVASTSVSIGGISEQHKAVIYGNLFMGGNSTTVGLFTNDTPANAPAGALQETLIPNTGLIRCNIASHCRIDSLVMGANGRNIMKFVPEYKEGDKWIRGFHSEEEFLHFCRQIDVSTVPQLTFNRDRQFHNKYAIDDRFGNMREFETPSEMNAVDIVMNAFIGGGYRGSMTSDSVLNYTLPPGVFINNMIVGGSRNPIFRFKENAGADKGKERTFIGGIRPYQIDNKQYHRIQLNIFCQFAEVKEDPDDKGNTSHTGAKIFGGCYDRGIVLGATSINLHSSLLGKYDKKLDMFTLANQMNSEGGHIYGAGKGVESEVIGNTYVALRGCTFNGQRLMPAALNVFGGGMQGQVIGRSNVQIDIEAPNCTGKEASFYAIYGKVYGGGRMGNILFNSRAIPGLTAEGRGASTHVTINSGHIQEVYGGSRMGDVEGGTWVDINDRARWHGHTVITNVYGGNDISGNLGFIRLRPEGLNSAVRTNTYVHITESPKADSTYTGFPFIGNLYGGGNGRYGNVDSESRYVEGAVQTRNSDTIMLAGRLRPDVDSTYIDMTGGTVWNLYGGANAAQVREFGMIRLNVRDTTARATFDRIISPECFEFGSNMYRTTHTPEGWIYDDTRMKARYNVHRIFGGNNYSSMNIQPTWRLLKGKVGTIYGGCNSGDVLYYNEAGDHLSANSNNNEIIEPGLVLPLNSTNLFVDNVYGGSRMGTVRASRITVDKQSGRRDTIPVTFADNQYGTNIFIGAGQYGRVFGGNDVSGTIENGTRISMEGGVVNEIYGAGNGDYYYQVSDQVNKPTETWDEKERRWYYRVPKNPDYNDPATPGINKILSINDSRPNCTKCYVEIAGGIRSDRSRRTAYVSGAIYAGGLGSTICGVGRTEGIIRLDIGNHCVINQLYMGSNGEHHSSRSYIDKLMEYNGITNKDESSSEFSLIEAHMYGVAMHGLPTGFQLHRTYDETYIGSFFVGGNHASLLAHGSLVVNFPVSLTIFDKIVGGSNMADFNYVCNDANRTNIPYRGGIGWDGTGSKPQVTLNVNCQFLDRVMNLDDQYREASYLVRRDDFDEEDTSPRVYSGCYGSGSVDGDIITNISDMSY